MTSPRFGATPDSKHDKLKQAMAAVDRINKSQGRNTIIHGAMGFEKKWAMRQDYLSRKFTTRMEDIIIVKAI